MDKEQEEKLINLTQTGYEKIAGEFSDTRQKFWEEFSPFLDYLKSGMNVLDVGCGNGRFYTEAKIRGLKYEGVDFSPSLINLAREKHPDGNFKIAEARSLPYENGIFDAVVSFAVIHHLPGNTQAEALREIKRVLKPGGIIIASVWDLWATKKKEIILSRLKDVLSKNKLPLGDIVLPFGVHQNARYLHAFRKKELENLAKNAGFESVSVKQINMKGLQSNLILTAKT